MELNFRAQAKVDFLIQKGYKISGVILQNEERELVSVVHGLGRVDNFGREEFRDLLMKREVISDCSRETE